MPTATSAPIVKRAHRRVRPRLTGGAGGVHEIVGESDERSVGDVEGSRGTKFDRVAVGIVAIVAASTSTWCLAIHEGVSSGSSSWFSTAASA